MDTKHAPNDVAERAGLTHTVNSECWSRSDFKRAEACVSALAGIADPQAAIRTAREVLGDICAWLVAPSVTRRALDEIQDKSIRALKGLGGFCRLTPEEAEAAFQQAPEEPLSPDRPKEIVEAVAIKAAREALRGCLDTLARLDYSESSGTVRDARRALALLGGK